MSDPASSSGVGAEAPMSDAIVKNNRHSNNKHSRTTPDSKHPRSIDDIPSVSSLIVPPHLSSPRHTPHAPRTHVRLEAFDDSIKCPTAPLPPSQQIVDNNFLSPTQIGQSQRLSGAYTPTAASCASSLAASSSFPFSQSFLNILRQYEPVYPSFTLIFKQLQLPSLWDRLFTHATGRDLLCKIVQHACGLIRCLIELYERFLRKFMHIHQLRRIFMRGIPELPLATSTSEFTPSTPAALTSNPTAAALLLPSTSASSVPAPVLAAAAAEEPEAWVPPYDESAPASFSHKLRHISYTMYRARQVLRLGRWLYDIPDVKDSALELWYGTTEEKSIEEQEAEEEWEEHERVHVVRSLATRRSSFDFAAMSPSAQQAFQSNLASTSNNPGASPIIGNSTQSTSTARGTFLFPLSSRLNASLPALARSSSLSSLPVNPAGNSCHSTTAAMRLSSDSNEQWQQNNSSTCSTDSSPQTASDSDLPQGADGALVDSKAATLSVDASDDEEEVEDEMTLLEWSVGVVDLTNSLMGLIIDASDDVDFISSVGLIPESWGEAAGKVSSYLWLISGGIDVAMCCYKLHQYRLEMRETIEEKMAEAREKQIMERQMVQAQLLSDPHSMPTTPTVFQPTQRIAPMRWNPTFTAPVGSHSISLCTSSCDIDCFHVEYLRLYRYIGELGLSVCGVLELWDVQSLRLETLLEASGLLSGIATLVKRGATHARSKKLQTKHAHEMNHSHSSPNLNLYE